MIELLVVIAIIAILAGMLLPALGKAKARRVASYSWGITRLLVPELAPGRRLPTRLTGPNASEAEPVADCVISEASDMHNFTRIKSASGRVQSHRARHLDE